MSEPWEDYAPVESGPWTDYQTEAAPAPRPTRTLGQEFKRDVGLIGRMGVNAVASIPLMAMDMGVAGRNLATGSKYELPSSMWRKGMDQLFPVPETGIEKVSDFIGTAAFGSKLPAPQIANPAPPGFVPPNPRMEAFTKAREAGYVAPPSTVNPTMANRTTEGLAGKLTTAQMASAKNQATTNTLVETELGLSGNAPLTKAGIKEIRQEAMAGYDAIRKAGEMTLDDQFKAALNKAEVVSTGANRSFANIAKNPVADEIESLRGAETFDAGDGIDAIRILRDKADEAFAKREATAGRAYKQMAKALEDVIERNLKSRGKDGAEMLSQYRDSRALLAKTYSAEKAFNPSTGNIDATKLARQLEKGAPLSGGIKTAAEFAQAFPKAARSFNESLPGMSPLDFYASGGISAGSGNPMYLGIPFARMAARRALLSDPWQNALIPKPYVPPEELAMGLGVGLGAIPQAQR